VITDGRVGEVIIETLEETPGRDTRWSTRSDGLGHRDVADGDLADLARLRSQAACDRDLEAAVDERSHVQAIDRTAPILPIMPTAPARMTHDYVRHGTTGLFAAFDISSGSVVAQHYRCHRYQECLRFLKPIDDAVPKGLNLHLVLDNYATHKTPRPRSG
jgi:hypothetical protein